MENQAILKQKLKTGCYSNGPGYGPFRWCIGATQKSYRKCQNRKFLILTSFLDDEKSFLL